MMKIKIIAMGKLKEKHFLSAAGEYAKRLSAFCSLEVIEIPPEKLSDTPSEKEILSVLKTEAASIEKRIPVGALRVAMCIEGKEMPSEDFGSFFNNAAVSGTGCIAFIIGSSYGLDKDLKLSCDRRLSMSQMTFPHELARVMLLEQIYRAFKIIQGSRYHK